MNDPRLVSARAGDDDAGFDQSLRPRALDEYVGQPQVIANLRVAIEAAKSRGEASTTSCSSVLPGWARLRSLTSSPPSWE